MRLLYKHRNTYSDALSSFSFLHPGFAIPYEGSHNSHFHIMNFFRSDRNNFQRKLQAVVSAKLNHDT